MTVKPWSTLESAIEERDRLEARIADLKIHIATLEASLRKAIDMASSGGDPNVCTDAEYDDWLKNARQLVEEL